MKTKLIGAVSPLLALWVALGANSAAAASYETSIKAMTTGMLGQSNQMVGAHWRASITDQLYAGVSAHSVLNQMKYDDGYQEHKATYYDFTADAQYRFRSFWLLTPSLG